MQDNQLSSSVHTEDIKLPETKTNLAISGVAGLVTGGLIGMLLSSTTLWLLHRSGKKRKSKWLIWAAIGVVAAPFSWAILGAFVDLDKSEAGTQSSSESVSESPSKKAVSQPLPSPSPMAKVQDRVVVDDRSIRVDSVSFQNSITSDNVFAEDAVAKGKFVILTVTAENLGNETGNLAFSRFKLLDSEGREYSESDSFEVTMVEDTIAPDRTHTDIPPGLTSTFPLIYDVAPDATSFVLEWKGQEISLDLD